MLFNEPKLLKSAEIAFRRATRQRFSALQRAEIAETAAVPEEPPPRKRFSALQRAEIAEIGAPMLFDQLVAAVSVLFNEPKLLKFPYERRVVALTGCFSALQRAEIAEILPVRPDAVEVEKRFSALQRAEIAEIPLLLRRHSRRSGGFSALQRAEIAENFGRAERDFYNESFSALQRAEIAESCDVSPRTAQRAQSFQCSSTSRNC